MNHWYVAKIAPGASRDASDLDCEPYRNGETVAERKIWNAAFDCYYPRLRREIVHHRTNKLVVKAFPLFQTYIFVSLPTANAEWLKDCKGVSYVLGSEGKMFPVDGHVARLQEAEHEMLFDDTRESRIKHKLEARTKRENVLRTFQRDMPIRVRIDRSHPFSGFTGMVTGATSRGTIEAVLSLFGRLTPVEFAPNEIEIAA